MLKSSAIKIISIFIAEFFLYYNIDFIFKVFYDLTNEIETKDLINFLLKFLGVILRGRQRFWFKLAKSLLQKTNRNKAIVPSNDLLYLLQTTYRFLYDFYHIAY